jgi:trans-aconitate methyltransferase
MFVNVKKAIFGAKRFKPSTYQALVGMNGSLILHKNSVELRSILKSKIDFSKINHIYEMGSGPCRNLFYIFDHFPDKKYSCSDLSKEESFKEMNPLIREVINFHEGDSEKIINDIKDVDLFICSDHLMHLQYEKAENILNYINDNLKPKYIILREIMKEFETPQHPRLFHDYEKLEKNYQIIHSSISMNSKEYFIKIYELKN